MVYEIQNGDQITIVTNKNQRPTEDWLKMVTTGKAKAKIRSAMKEERRKHGALGKEALERKLRHLKINSIDDTADVLVKHYQFLSHVDLYYALAMESLTISEIFKTFVVENGKIVLKEHDLPILEEELVTKPSKQKRVDSTTKLVINGEPADKYDFSLASCCNPVQGDDIFAYLTANAGLKIHRTSCPNADNIMVNYGYRVMKADWVGTTDAFFVAELVITGIDDGPGIIQRLTHEISNLLGLNIRSFNISGDGGYYEGKVSLLVKNTEQLKRVIYHLENLPSVSSVRRLDNP
jgi:GTP pyrophosphokinase